MKAEGSMARLNWAAPYCAGLFFAGLLTLAVNMAVAQGPQSGGGAADEQQIRQLVAGYVEAFNKHDAKAVADCWSPDAVYQNRSKGEQVVGRTAIAEQFAGIFKAQPAVKVE